MDRIKELTAAMEAELVEIRRDLHRHPELSNEERRTSDLICARLESWEIPYERGLAGTGVMAVIQGAKPGKTVGIRADMDALPVEEAGNPPYRSECPGVMHACGHDAHTAILLGAAKLFKEMQGELSGTVKCFFQPAEETTGGALRMIEAGCLENPHVDYVLGLHVSSAYEAGHVGVRYGKMMAASDEFTIVLKGKSCHGAHPDQGNDTMVMAAAVIGGLQTIVSRNISPTDSAVCTIGKIKGGVAGNVICDRLQMDGILRSLTPAGRDFLRERLVSIVENTAKAYGGEGTAEFHFSYPALINTDEAVDAVKAAAVETLGEAQVTVEPEPELGTEDFSYFAERRPACFWHLGCANRERGIGADLHSCYFDIDESCLALGVEIQARAALKLLKTE